MLAPELATWFSRAPTTAGFGIAALLLGLLWMFADRVLVDRLRLHRVVAVVVRVVLGTLCLWLSFRALSGLFVFGTTQPLIFWAGLGAAAAELIRWLFALEAGSVERPLARRLLALRLGALGLVLLVLLEPLWAIHGERRVDKTVVVLIDDSESMHLQDDGWSQSQRLDLAGLFDPRSIAGRPRQAAGLRQLENARSGIAAALDTSDIKTPSPAPTRTTPPPSACCCDVSTNASNRCRKKPNWPTRPGCRNKTTADGRASTNSRRAAVRRSRGGY